MNLNDSRSYLHIATSEVIEGQNFKEVRATWKGISDFQLIDKFTYKSKSYAGAWVIDSGDHAAPANTRERRAFSTKGKATTTFNGTSAYLRVSLNPGWGKATILVDGVAPSTIPGVTLANDTLSSDAALVDSWGNEFRDFCIAEGLPPGEHTVQIIVWENSATGWFIFSGMKIYSIANNRTKMDVYSVKTEDRHQIVSVRIKNKSAWQALDIQLDLSPKLIHMENYNSINQVTLPNIPALSEYEFNCRLSMDGTEPTGVFPNSLTYTATLRDPDGLIPLKLPNLMGVSSPSVSFSAAWWVDAPTETMPEILATDKKNAWVKFKTFGDDFRVNMYHDYGNGEVTLYKNPVTDAPSVTVALGATTYTVSAAIAARLSVGMQIISTTFPVNTSISDITGTTITTTQAATQATANRTMVYGNWVREYSSHGETEAFQQIFINVKFAGLGATYNGDVLLVTKSAGKLVAFKDFSPYTFDTYSRVTDTIYIDANVSQVAPQAISNVRLENGRVEYDQPTWFDHDLVSDQPFDNRGVDKINVEYRFPTFICCYTAGYKELFKQYDIVITDPMALNYREILELQALGIKVINYVSFGEEDGVLTNIWDTTSPQGPWPGDGLGPGGYASYYCKGNYGNGEFSECANDRHRWEGVKACSKADPKYFTGVGRCSKACNNDWRTGYATWVEGGACKAGKTSANHWERDVSTACSNSACPTYAPVHQKCTQYEAAENAWGQDFSVATQDFPDENGIWSSYYIDAVGRGPNSWFARLRDYYLPMVFDRPKYYDEVLTVQPRTLLDASTVMGVLMTHAPIDANEGLTVTDVTTGIEYPINVNFSFDEKIGTIVLSAEAPDPLNPPAVPGPPVPYAGQQVRVKYWKRGLYSDGVFMDTVDTVDVYPAEVFQQGFADLIIDLKALYHDRSFCSNRGFSIYDRMIHACDYIMTESVFSEYDFHGGTGTYDEVSPEAAAWNAEVAHMIQELRRKHVFDVVCLNYASNGPEDDHIRESVVEKTLNLGWMPWLSTILLNDPLPNRPFYVPHGRIRTNQWRKIRVKNL